MKKRIAMALVATAMVLTVAGLLTGNSPGNKDQTPIQIQIEVTGPEDDTLKQETVTLPEGGNPIEVLKGTGAQYKTKGSGDTLYVYEIEGIGEGQKGPMSGWVYTVNNQEIYVGAAVYALEDGDEVLWYYASFE